MLFYIHIGKLEENNYFIDKNKIHLSSYVTSPCKQLTARNKPASLLVELCKGKVKLTIDQSGNISFLMSNIPYAFNHGT